MSEPRRTQEPRVAELVKNIDDYRTAAASTTLKANETISVGSSLAQFGSGSNFINNSGVKAQQKNVNVAVGTFGLASAGSGAFLALAVGSAALGPFGIFTGVAGLAVYGAKRFVNNYEKKLKGFAEEIDQAKGQLSLIAENAKGITQQIENGMQLSEDDLATLRAELDDVAKEFGLQEVGSIRPDKSAHSDLKPILSAIKDARHKVHEFGEGGTASPNAGRDDFSPGLVRPGPDQSFDPPTQDIGR